MSNTHLRLKPKNPKLVIRDPRTLLKLPPEGMRVPNNEYWRARLRDKDVEELTAVQLQAGQAKAQAEASSKAKKESDTKDTKQAAKAKKDDQ